MWVSEEGGKELDVRDPQWGTHEGASDSSVWTKIGRLRTSQPRAWPLEGKVGVPSLTLVGEGALKPGKPGMEWKPVWQSAPGDGVELSRLGRWLLGIAALG